jgi:Transmembrane domain of unknown function (DUF3566)
MSNSGDEQPLAPRRSLRKSQTPVDQPTPPLGMPTYAGGSQPRGSTQVASLPDGTPGGSPHTAADDEPRTATQPGVAQRQPQSPQQPAPASRGADKRARTVRRARLRLIRIDPWSVTKTAFLLSIAFGIMCVVAVFLILSVMNAAGLWDHVNQSIQSVLNQDPATAFDIKDYVGTRRIMGLTMLIAALDVVLITALATLGAFLYNMAASLLGGVEVSLAEDAKR